jgi:predicted DNA-binding helix-hairpin-helix protein
VTGKTADDKPSEPDSVKINVKHHAAMVASRPNSGALKLDLVAVSFAAQQNFGVGCMVSFSMNGLVHWFVTNGNVLAVVVTAGVAVLIICCLECTECPRREKDDLFRRREL